MVLLIVITRYCSSRGLRLLEEWQLASERLLNVDEESNLKQSTFICHFVHVFTFTLLIKNLFCYNLGSRK